MTPNLEDATGTLDDIASGASAMPQAPDIQGDLAKEVAAGSGSAAALAQAGEGQQSETQILGIKQAQQQTAQVQQQAGQAAQQLRQGQTELEKKTVADFANITEQQAGQVQDYRNKAMAVLQSLTRGRADMSLARQKSAAEQAGFLIRQSSKSYVDTLQMEGQKARLSSMSAFRNALIEQQFADQKDLLDSDLSFRKLMGAEQRDFNKEMANMDLSFAMNLMVKQSEAAITAGQLSAASSLASTGAKAYVDSNKSSTATGQGEIA
jgi:hypothetical protein